MKNKKILFKNVFYIFAALFFVGAGFLFVPKQSTALALDTTTVGNLGDQSLKEQEYFSVEDFVTNEAGEEQDTQNSLKDFDTFLYSSTQENSFRLSFVHNGGDSGVEEGQDFFNYVFYPNPSDRTTFKFFSITNINLFVNGVSQTLKEEKFIVPLQPAFEYTALNPEIFEMVLDKDGTGEHSLSIFKDGKVMEGLWTLELQYVIYTCNNGDKPLNELNFENAPSGKQTFSFFVTDRADYFTNSRPKVTNVSFDHVVENESSQQSQDAFVLYSNFSSQAYASRQTAPGTATTKNEIPNIKFDYLRFEADVVKDNTSISVKFNIDNKKSPETEAPVVLVKANPSDADLVHLEFDQDSHTAQMFFTDVGEYDVKFRPIQVLEIETEHSTNETVWQKFKLDSLASITKNVKVHMFGYQMTYTDFDEAPNSNNVRPTKDFKEYDFSNGKFKENEFQGEKTIAGADITSDFLYSKDEFSQQSNTTFTRGNIFEYINKQTELKDNLGNPIYAHSPVKTNQTPLKFNSNAKISSIEIFSNVKVSDEYQEISQSYVPGGFQGATLYRNIISSSDSALGKYVYVENTPGKYVYVVTYTYDNLVDMPEDFHQVFFLEIVKGLPEISIKTESGETVMTQTYVNESVKISDTTKNDPFNKDVTVVVYVWNYLAENGENDGIENLTENGEGHWLEGFGGASGMNLLDFERKSGDAEFERTISKEMNARYIIRLYYTSDIQKDQSKRNYKTGSGFLREQTFVIDSEKPNGIEANNFQQIAGSSRYVFHSKLDSESDKNFSTNQSIAFSWNEKKSHAKTWAYYRYFPLVDAQYYALIKDYNNPEDPGKKNVDNLLRAMLTSTDPTLPVNKVLDLSTTYENNGKTERRNWIPYEGNIKGLNTDSLKSDYILSDPGLYLLDVYDAAGNHTLDVFMIDNSKPIFALYDAENGYTFPTSPFINTASTLYWGKYKAIYISGLDNQLYLDETEPELEKLSSDFYKTYYGETSKEIYSCIMDKLVKGGKIKNLTTSVVPDKDNGNISPLIKQYSGLYVMIKIDPISWFTNSEEYQQNDRDTYFVEFKELKEMTYTVLIRDESNTKKFKQWTDEALQQYTTYHSASQTIIVSFDDSQFYIQYTDEQNVTQYLMSNNTSDDGETLTTYLSPTRLNKPLVVTFRPTNPDNHNIQVKSVTMEYYKFEPQYKLVPNEVEMPGDDVERQKYWYYGFSQTPSEPETFFYDFDEEGNLQSTDARTIDLKVSDKVTQEGKYVITRTYMTGGSYDHNKGDYVTRTYVLIVDRNKVVTDQQSVGGNGDDLHLESLVGGDMFISMYDTAKNSDLVISFPDSANGNMDNVSILSNSLFTNKLPVKVYVPQYKYTTLVQKNIPQNGTQNEYEFEVYYNFATQELQTDGNPDTMNYFTEEKLIREYALYAEIYKDISPENGNAVPIAVTSTNRQSPDLTSVQQAADGGNGFLRFFDYASGNELKMLYEPGTYYVKVFQGMFGTAVGENSYQEALTFRFVIEKTSPDFDVKLSNSFLDYDDATANSPQTYYTNQNVVEISWDASTDKNYMAKIDISQLKFSTSSNENFVYDLKTNTYSTNRGTIWRRSPDDENGSKYVGYLDLSLLDGVYENGGWVDITMQYENHDIALKEDGISKIYDPITKRIFVDLSAPHRNIDTLVQKSMPEQNMFSAFNEDAIRDYRKADDTPADSFENTSYNISQKEGSFRYYSFSVTKDFLSTLKNNESGTTTYVRAFKKGGINTKYTSEPQETDYNHFTTSDFTNISQMDAFEANTYYEIVETDRAQNKTIYTIYVADQNQQQNIIEYYDENNILHAYTTADYNNVKAHPGAIHNIFSRTGFKLQNINFFGDAWAIISLVTNSTNSDTGELVATSRNIMLTPYGIYDENSREDNISISSLINGKESLSRKHSMTIFNRLNPQDSPTFYFNIFNKSLEAQLTESQNQELISFDYVSDAVIQDKSIGNTPFVVGMKISIDGTAIYSGGLTAAGESTQVKNPLGYASEWKNFVESPTADWNGEYVRVYRGRNSLGRDRLIFEINPNYPAITNARVEYEFTDNYGVTYYQTHLFRGTVISKSVTSENEARNPLYSYDVAGIRHYIIKDALQYNFNKSEYHVEAYEVNTFVDADEHLQEVRSPLANARMEERTVRGVTTYTFRTTRTTLYHDNFVLVLYDALDYLQNGSVVDDNISAKGEVYFSLYNQIPTENLDITTPNTAGQFQLKDVNGKLINSRDLLSSSQGFYSQVNVTFNQLPDAFIPVKFSYREEGGDWQEITSGTRIRNDSDSLKTYYLKIWYNEQFLENNLDSSPYTYVFEKVPDEQIFKFSLSAFTSNYWIEKVIDGETLPVEKAENSFKTSNGSQPNHYIVNVSYDENKKNKKVFIHVNKELNISGEETPIETISNNLNSAIKSEIYLLTNRGTPGVPLFETTIVITYVPDPDENNPLVKDIFTFNGSGTLNTSENLRLLNEPTKMLPIAKGVDVDKTQIVWSKYYGTPENEINLSIWLGDLELKPVVFTKKIDDKDYKYIYLTTSGLYTLQFKDAAGHIQKFYRKDANGKVLGETEKFEFIFLKDVPFTVTYTSSVTGLQETNIPVKQAIYNGAVTINLDPTTMSRFYRGDGRPSLYDINPENSEQRICLVKRNGVVYDLGYENSNQYTFTETGYYEISFAASSSLPTVDSIRQETYSFTIINGNEHKFSYVFNKYANYYVEKIIKDGQDQTERLTAELDCDKIVVDGKEYLTQLPLSYLDDKTGAGEYLITINTNEKAYYTEGFSKTFTFKVKINRGTAPIRISLKEGESTTGTITLSYNLSNLYLEMGESTLRVLRQLENNAFEQTESVQINAQSTGESSLTISTTGTYFIQIVSPSNNLLFTYKVVRNEPLNTAAIISIVVAAVVLAAVILIIIKLRKRISVK